MFSLLMVIGVLTSCNNGQIENYKKIMCPTGAPSICFYEKIDQGLETGKATLVKSQLLTNNYGSVVFDFYNGLKLLKNKENYDFSKDFKLARILTGGNFYLVGINKDVEPDTTSKIVSFSKNSLPDLVYKKIYGESIYSNTEHVADNEAASAILASGLYNAESVDYVVIAEPALTKVMENKDAPTYGKLHVISSLKNKWKDLTNQTCIPQAGLFVRQDYYDSYKNYFNTYFDEIDNSINNVILNPNIVKETIDKKIDGSFKQKSLFGFDTDTYYSVMKEDKNGFAIVDKTESKNIDIQVFLSSLNIKEDYSSYLLQKGE